MPIDPAATIALQTVLNRKKEMSIDLMVDSLLEKFGDAVRGTNPDMTFHVGDIRAWAREYTRSKGVDVPEEILNTYSLGRYIKANYVRLGFADLGTYGNRQIYGIVLQNPKVTV